MKIEYKFSEPVKDYLEHIGILTCEQDYLNKKTILGKLSEEESALAIKALQTIPGFEEEWEPKNEFSFSEKEKL